MAKGKEQKAKVEEATVAAPAPVEAPAPVVVIEFQPDPDPVPTYTLRADRRIDLLALTVSSAPESVIREFELYEERHR